MKSIRKQIAERMSDQLLYPLGRQIRDRIMEQPGNRLMVQLRGQIGVELLCQLWFQLEHFNFEDIDDVSF